MQYLAAGQDQCDTVRHAPGPAPHGQDQHHPGGGQQPHGRHVKQEGVQLHDVVAGVHVHQGQQLGRHEHKGGRDEGGGGDGA